MFMKLTLALLWGSILFSPAMGVRAQTGGSSGQALQKLFSSVARSSSDPADPLALPAKSGKETETAPISEEAIKTCCEKVENDKRRIYYVSDRNNRMALQLTGIYTRGPLLFFHLLLSNRSHLDYDMDSIRFFIADRRPAKNPDTKAVELKPVYVYGNVQLVRGKSREPSVIALRRFTLPPGKHLVILAREKNGGRHLQLQADNFTLVRARLI